jgi:integrase
MVTANRVRSSLSALFSWAIQTGIAEGNPVDGTRKETERARDRVLSPDEIRSIWNNLREDDFGAVTKLLLLTACRVNEIALLRWSEIHDDMLVLPPERVKSKRSHIVPLSGPAIAILAARRRTDSDLVFGKRRFTSWGKDLLDQTIAKTTGKPLAHWTPHDMRRTAATMMAELGIQPHVIEAVLNHAGHRSGVSGIYNRSGYEAEKRTALAHWAEHVTAIIEGRETNVVTLRA